MGAKKTRQEKDSMGVMQVPHDALWGASTQRAVHNFPISGITFDRSFVAALGQIKISCAVVNRELKVISPKIARAIESAAKEVRDGKHDTQFVVDIFQTGSGTSTNMNANEVIAQLASKKLGGRVHPNDHVNASQSSNDVIPSAIHVAAAVALERGLLPELKLLQKSLAKKARAFAEIHKSGRTHLQDATPVTLGQEFSGYAEQIAKSVERVSAGLPHLRELALGGTAVGTGVNAPRHFGKKVAAHLSKSIGIKFREAKNHFEAQGAKDACAACSGALKTTAVSLTKIANDLRWLSCGPRCGLNEIILPAVQPGSSIMPGKVNPVIPESVLQVCAQVIGNDATIAWAGAAGNFELNVMMPVIAHNLLQSIHLLLNSCRNLRIKCVEEIAPNKKNCAETIEKNLSLCTVLAPVVGYDEAARLAKRAYLEDKTIRAVVLEEGILSEKDLAKLLDVKRMV